MAITYPLSLPTVTGFRSTELMPETVVGFNRSPFTGAQQIYPWSAQWLQFMIELPPMRETSAAIWSAFFMSLNGPEGAFYLGPSIRKTPTNAISQLEQVGSGAVANSTTLPITGINFRFTKGDWLSVGSVNHLTYSEQFDHANWTKSGATISADSDTAPDGATTADRIVENSATSTHRISQAVANVQGRFTFSLFAKRGTSTRRMSIKVENATTGTCAEAVFNLSTSSIQSVIEGSAEIIAAPSSWDRICVSGESELPGVTVTIAMTDASGSASYLGNGTSYLIMWGAQLNLGPAPMGYLVTTSAAVVQSPRLHRVVQVNSATSVDVFPRLRSAYAAGTPISTRSPVGLFRCAGMVSEGYDSRQICQGMQFTAFEDIT